MCSTPLLVNDLLIVNPGARSASLAALDSLTGQTRWITPGDSAAYSAFITAKIGSQTQIIGYDQHSLGGWDLATGRRLWKMVPPMEGDFNVTTPIALENGLVLSTENNGTRLYRFTPSGRIIDRPESSFPDLSPTTSTPVVTSDRIFGAHLGFYCLDLKNSLKPIWHLDDESIGDHATLFADDERVLAVTLAGELILFDARANHCAILSRLRLFDESAEIYSHPALVGSRLFVRGPSSVACIDLAMN
jgi:outer membrane protein assembly factor BamB